LDFKVCKNTSVLFLTLQSEEIENVVNKGLKSVVRAGEIMVQELFGTQMVSY
jgi:hypothetical protein